MVDLTEHEQAAIHTAVKAVAELLDEIGWQTRLADLTEPQVRALIETAVEGFQVAMHAMAASNTGSEVPF